MVRDNSQDYKVETKPTRCHYVPQFILRNYDSSIDLFNVKTQQYIQNRTPLNIFWNPDLYPQSLESRLNEQMESDEARRLTRKILTKEGNIELTRDDVQHLKRFFLTGMIRAPDTPEIIGEFRKWLSEGLVCSVYSENLGDRYRNDLNSDESDHDYWIRTMSSILNNSDFNPYSIMKDPDST